uniref:Uncharacterized protein n=1 Tax=Heliobacterium mobile TaxID=28064 RepID=Q9ZGG3_HELMO|nr:unknown [Heliobacterium mobile]
MKGVGNDEMTHRRSIHRGAATVRFQNRFLI